MACEGPYLVHVADPGVNPPNLAAVQEISAGIYRVGADGHHGGVGAVGGRHPAQPIPSPRPARPRRSTRGSSPRTSAALSVAFIRQNGQFRQINQDPTYLGTDVLQMGGNLRLERFLPTSLGLAVPLTVTYARTATNPELLTGTDIRGRRADRTAEAGHPERDRQPGDPPRDSPGRNWLTRGLLDPLSVTASYTQGHAITELSEAKPTPTP